MQIGTFWHGGELSWIELLSLASLREVGHDITLFSYRFLDFVPRGITVRDASEILPESAVFSYANGTKSFSAFSNAFRYQLINATDYVWADCDVLGLAPMSLPPEGYIFGFESPGVVNGALLGAPQESDLSLSLLDGVARADIQNLKWGQIGPQLVTSAVKRLGLLELALPISQIYPLHYSETWRYFDPESIDFVRKRCEDSKFAHLWNEVIRRAPLNLKKYSPPKGSFLHELGREIGCSPFQSLPPIDSKWVVNKWRALQLIESKMAFLSRTIHRLGLIRSETR